MLKVQKGLGLFVWTGLVFFLCLPVSAETVELRIRVEKANIRQQPMLTAAVIGSARMGETFQSSEKQGEWYKIEFPSEKKEVAETGFIHQSMVEVVSSAAGQTEAIRSAQPRSASPSSLEAKRAQSSGGMKLGVKLTGGLGYFAVGDFNAHIQGIYNLMEDNGDTVEGEFKPAHTGMDFSGEVILDLTPRMGIGLGIGFHSVGRESTVIDDSQLTPEVFTYEVTVNPRVRAIPLSLSLHYRLPVNDRTKFLLTAGTAYFFSKVRWNYHSERIDTEPPVFVIISSNEWESSAGALGFFGGIGLEIDILPTVALVIEGKGTAVKLKNLKGDYRWYSQEGVWSYSDTISDAIFWYYDMDSPTYPRSYPWIYFDDKEQYRWMAENHREGEVDLSGFSVRVGFRMRFGR